MINMESFKDYSQYLDGQYRLKYWSSKEKYKKFIYEFLGDKFLYNKIYSEKEINEILDRHHIFNDVALLRRELFEAKILYRTINCKEYWRVIDKHNIILNTENELSKLETNHLHRKNEWVMWMDLKDLKKRDIIRELIFKEVETEQDIQDMFILRMEVESIFGIVENLSINLIMDNIKSKIKILNAKYFLVYKFHKPIGAIGIVPFTYKNLKIGRLQDVDITPSKQGHGYGNDILNFIINFGSNMKLDALCLFAKNNEWKKDWYSRKGFNKVGEV